MNLAEALKAWLEHRKVVLVRRTQHRLDQIARRLEVLDGYLVAYLNLDEVIQIIREEDDSKAILMARFNLTDDQAEAILNMRLRSLRKLEEIEIRTEHKTLTDEQAQLRTLLGSDKRQWGEIAKQVECPQDRPTVPRPTSAAAAPTLGDAPDADVHEEADQRLHRARADHHHPLREGLDPRPQGPHRRRRREGLQGRRPPEADDQGRDHRQAAAALDRRQGLHPRAATACRAAAGRASRCG